VRLACSALPRRTPCPRSYPLLTCVRRPSSASGRASPAGPAPPASTPPAAVSSTRAWSPRPRPPADSSPTLLLLAGLILQAASRATAPLPAGRISTTRPGHLSSCSSPTLRVHVLPPVAKYCSTSGCFVPCEFSPPGTCFRRQGMFLNLLARVFQQHCCVVLQVALDTMVFPWLDSFCIDSVSHDLCFACTNEYRANAKSAIADRDRTQGLLPGSKVRDLVSSSSSPNPNPTIAYVPIP
jgi:hypothetical protein